MLQHQYFFYLIFLNSFLIIFLQYFLFVRNFPDSTKSTRFVPLILKILKDFGILFFECN